MPRIGLEPTHLAIPEPKSGVSTNSTTWARGHGGAILAVASFSCQVELKKRKRTCALQTLRVIKKLCGRRATFAAVAVAVFAGFKEFGCTGRWNSARPRCSMTRVADSTRSVAFCPLAGRCGRRHIWHDGATVDDGSEWPYTDCFFARDARWQTSRVFERQRLSK